ncbi:hypothetical protein RYX36_024329 [Vicia faba]
MGARESKFKKWISGGSVNNKSIQGPMLLVPKGYVPICVGTNEDTCRIFMVHVSSLGDAFFCELLGKSEEVYGLRTEGVLRIPFEAQEFEELFIGRSNKNNKVKRMVIPT